MFGSIEIISIGLYTPLCNPLRYATLRGLHGVIEVISSWTEQKLRSILDNPLILKYGFLNQQHRSGPGSKWVTSLWVKGFNTSFKTRPGEVFKSVNFPFLIFYGNKLNSSQSKATKLYPYNNSYCLLNMFVYLPTPLCICIRYKCTLM